MSSKPAAICRSCRVNPAICVGLCSRCGLRSAQAERTRRAREERRQQAQDRRERRMSAPAAWPEPEVESA
jgi:hypothetical protein